MTFNPPEIIIWALNDFKWHLGSSTLEKGVIFVVMKWGGINSSIISYKNSWGLSHDDMSGERARALLLPCLCMILRNSSFIFCSFSFIQTIFSTNLLEESTAPMSHSWFVRASSQLVWASSRRRSCPTVCTKCSRQNSRSEGWRWSSRWSFTIVVLGFFKIIVKWGKLHLLTKLWWSSQWEHKYQCSVSDIE